MLSNEERCAIKHPLFLCSFEIDERGVSAREKESDFDD
tara:strand:+ start:3296 stop:3409 length:114 start_codon:yes stop_codon:yes gene_type:complete